MMPTNWRKSRTLPKKLRKNRVNSCYRPRYDRSKYTSNSCFQPRFDSDLGQASMGLMLFDFRRMPIFHTLMLLQKTKRPVLKLSKCRLASWSMERNLLEPNLLERNFLERNLLENSYSWLSWMNCRLKSEIKEAKLHTTFLRVSASVTSCDWEESRCVFTDFSLLWVATNRNFCLQSSRNLDHEIHFWHLAHQFYQKVKFKCEINKNLDFWA